MFEIESGILPTAVGVSAVGWRLVRAFLQLLQGRAGGGVGLVGGGRGVLGHLQPLGQLLGVALRLLGPLLCLRGRGGGAGGLLLEVLGAGGQVLGAPARGLGGLLLALSLCPGALQGIPGLSCEDVLDQTVPAVTPGKGNAA